MVTTQVLKCLATVVANVPYQRLRPGLLGSTVKQIRPFLSHRGWSTDELSDVHVQLLELFHLVSRFLFLKLPSIV